MQLFYQNQSVHTTLNRDYSLKLELNISAQELVGNILTNEYFPLSTDEALDQRTKNFQA